MYTYRPNHRIFSVPPAGATVMSLEGNAVTDSVFSKALPGRTVIVLNTSLNTPNFNFSDFSHEKN